MKTFHFASELGNVLTNQGQDIFQLGHGRCRSRFIQTLGAWEVLRVETITFEDFLKVELRVGKIVDATEFVGARKPAYILHVDFGATLGVKKSSAQITALYKPDDLVGRLVVAVVNFPRKQIGPLISECLVTGFHNQNGDVALCVPDKSVPLGTRLL
jgi:tRNA-binding protein